MLEKCFKVNSISLRIMCCVRKNHVGKETVSNSTPLGDWAEYSIQRPQLYQWSWLSPSIDVSCHGACLSILVLSIWTGLAKMPCHLLSIYLFQHPHLSTLPLRITIYHNLVLSISFYIYLAVYHCAILLPLSPSSCPLSFSTERRPTSVHVFSTHLSAHPSDYVNLTKASVPLALCLSVPVPGGGEMRDVRGEENKLDRGKREQKNNADTSQRI